MNLNNVIISGAILDFQTSKGPTLAMEKMSIIYYVLNKERERESKMGVLVAHNIC
jgi:hypothetical protein